MWAGRGSPNWKIWLFAAAAYGCVYSLALLVFGEGEARWSLASRAATLAPGLAASLGALAVWQARSPGSAWEPDGRLRQAWMFWGLAGLLWTGGQGLGLVYELSLRTPAPLPSVVEPVRLAGYVFAGLGLPSHPMSSRSGSIPLPASSPAFTATSRF